MKSFKIICLAFNYTDQGTWVRFGKNPPKEPVIYLKPRTSLIGARDDIICPNFVKELDYEGELALAIGKKCRKINEDDALKYVVGYFVFNDVSARDIQFVDKQYSRAKGFDTFGPCGPWITTSDEISNPSNLRITTKVNGETRQNSSTKNLVLKIERIIYRLSKVMTLEPGDIISTGTPSGTALSMSSNLKYLKHNDIVEVEIEKLGKIENRVLFVN
jgi:2-keto-4-pentenoate hydratase/2-oxohepta-3-ene-1,7-dioic acid hydratase in catechol pathway